MRVAPDGKATKMFEAKELAVQALAVTRTGGDCGDVAGWQGVQGSRRGWQRW